MTYDGVLTSGTATYSASNAKFGSGGVSGAAFNVDNVDRAFSVNPSSATGSYSSGTVEGWVKSPAVGAVRVLFGHDGWYWVGIDASNYATARFGNTDSEVSLTSTKVIADGAWHHVALVFVANTSVSLYVDGTRVATSTSKPAFDVDKGTRIGSLVSNRYNWTNASIDEVRYSNTARYTAATYTVPTAAFTPDSNSPGVYHFESDASNSGLPTQNIRPDDSNILYSPGNWDVTTNRAKTINAGAYFRLLVAGSITSAILQFDLKGVATPLPQLTITVDGVSTTQEIADQIQISLPSGNSWAKHTISVVVKSMTETQLRWDTQATAVSFLGIVTSPRTATTEAYRRRKLNVLVFGDSITEGVRTLNSTATNDTDRNDSMLGWAYHLGERLGAEVGVIGFGATGITKASGSGGVPSFKNSLGLLWGSGPSRDFTTVPLDAIVIMEGTNDGTTNTTADMIAALNLLIAATPATTKILVLRPFNGTNQAANLQNAIAGCSNPPRVTYIDTNGWWSTADSSDSLHPYGYTNLARISSLAADAVRTVFAGSGSFINVGGVAKPVSSIRV